MWTSKLYDTTKLTLELRDIVDNGVDIWDFDYPSFYEGEEKKAFEQKVIDHFYLRQIGQETVGRFKHYFKTRVREIMPRYVDMYNSVKMMREIDDIFGNIDITETFEEETTGTATGTASGSASGTTSGSSSETTSQESSKNISGMDGKTTVFSDTPQGSITNLDNYMTNVTKEELNKTEDVSENLTGSNNVTNDSESSSQSSETSETSQSGTVKHTLHRKGNQGVNTYAHDIIEYRQTLIDVDMMIINDLNCLFLGVY